MSFPPLSLSPCNRPEQRNLVLCLPASGFLSSLNSRFSSSAEFLPLKMPRFFSRSLLRFCEHHSTGFFFPAPLSTAFRSSTFSGDHRHPELLVDHQKFLPFLLASKVNCLSAAWILHNSLTSPSRAFTVHFLPLLFLSDVFYPVFRYSLFLVRVSCSSLVSFLSSDEKTIKEKQRLVLYYSVGRWKINYFMR